MNKDLPARRLWAAADLLGTRQVSMRPDLDKVLEDWLRYEAETLGSDPDDYCGERTDRDDECGDWYCGTIDRALAFADLLLEKP
jgi:hypothetical protein